MRLNRSSGPEKPTSGAWQLAHDWVPVTDIDSSKNTRLPSSASGVSAVSCDPAAVTDNASAIAIKAARLPRRLIASLSIGNIARLVSTR
jgi:hypothetical protein